MNMHANRRITLDAATRLVTTESEPFALNYERLDPESLRCLTERIEAEARQMRAQVLRGMVKDAFTFVYGGIAGLFTASRPAVRRERASA
jgi:hypothetical protein